MDYYSSDKHGCNLLSPPVISSTSCMPESSINDTVGYLNGNAYRQSVDSCVSSGHTYDGGTSNMRQDNLKMSGRLAPNDMFTENEYPIPSYYNLDSSAGHPHQHVPQLDDLKKSHISYHPVQSAQSYGSPMSCSMSGYKDYDIDSMYHSGMPHNQPTTPSVHNRPESSPIVSSNTGYNHSPPAGSVPHHVVNSSSSSPPSICVAKKSSSGYELKREMAESSGLSINGAPYVKSRGGRKGFSL